MSTTGFGQGHTKDSTNKDIVVMVDAGNKVSSVGATAKDLVEPTRTITHFNGVTSDGDKFSYDGVDQYTEIFEDLSAENPTDLSVSMWFRRNGTPIAGDTIVTKLTALNFHDFKLWWDPAFFQEDFVLWRFSPAAGGGGSTHGSPTTIDVGVWHFTTFVIRSTVDTVAYWNGAQQGLVVGVTDSLQNDSGLGKNILIGGGSPSIAAPVDITEIVVDTRALTLNEHIERYNATKHRFI